MSLIRLTNETCSRHSRFVNVVRLGVALLLVAFVAPQIVVAAQDQSDDSKTTQSQTDDPLERIRTMSAEDRDQLRQKRDRFESLSEGEQQRLRQLHSQLENHPNGDHLRRVMLKYDEWLRSLSPVLRAEILDLPTDQRIQKIKEIREKEARQAFGFVGDTKLPEENAPLLYDWIDGFIRLHESAIVDRLSENRQRELAKTVDDEHRRRRIAFSISKMAVDELRSLITEDDVKSLYSCLSPEARQILDDRPTDEERAVLVQRWIRFALIVRNPPKVTPEQLERFFSDDLTELERDQLDRMPPEQRHKHLIWMYYSKQNASSAKDKDKKEKQPECCNRRMDELFEEFWLS